MTVTTVTRTLDLLRSQQVERERESCSKCVLEAIEQPREDNIFATLELLGSEEITFSAKI